MLQGRQSIRFRRRKGGEETDDTDSSAAPTPSSSTGASSSSAPLQSTSSAPPPSQPPPSNSVSSPVPSPTAALSDPQQSSTTSHHHVDTVRIALGVVLGLLGLLFLIGMAFFLRRRRHRRRWLHRLKRPEIDPDPAGNTALLVPAPPYTPPQVSVPVRAPSMRQVDRADRSAMHTPAGTPLSRSSMLTSLSMSSSTAQLADLPPLKAAGPGLLMATPTEAPPPQYDDDLNSV
ncbi:hypothetical protein FB45DRAFT_900395 [Roridomyces roridus]|uniref:Mid2 domain-containing protein n=1 Tax=Roridomyces roridus TaxID=1738132 RepID=A0AAD7C811_9AGAR|nr:hypothetical protein FB45DRAFT_900395 [Roridomyces roridus]